MKPRCLVDTHVLIRWLIDSKRLSREQSQMLEQAVKRNEPVAFSAVTLLEIAMLVNYGKVSFQKGLKGFFEDLRSDPIFRPLSLSYEIALETGFLDALRDPADKVIVATARVHHLTLVTSDQRIIDSKLVPAVF